MHQVVIEPVLRDPDDDRILEVAVRSKAIISVSEELYRKAAEIAAAEHVSVEEVFTFASTCRTSLKKEN